MLLVFALEVLNPSTAFVREQPKPLTKSKRAKLEKTVSQQNQATLESSAFDTDEDYLSCSALLPATPAQLALEATEQVIAAHSRGAPQDFLRSIQRPPSRC